MMSPMASSLEKTTVYLDADIRRGLRALARSTGRPQAELIREALEAYLERAPRDPLPAWVGAWKHGPTTDAAEVKRAGREGWVDDLESPP